MTRRIGETRARLNAHRASSESAVHPRRGRWRGLRQENVEITVEKNPLNLVAHAEPRVPEGYEHRFGQESPVEYRRSFTLSDAIDRDAIVATMKHGIMRLSLPKASKAMPRKISVKAAG